jgi:hypothetical protein
MEQGYTFVRNDKIDRDAISNGNGQQNFWIRGDPAIDPFNLDPSVRSIDPFHRNAVNLVAEYDSLEISHLPPEAKPATHYVAHRLGTPESQVESPSRLAAAPRDPGANPV